MVTGGGGFLGRAIVRRLASRKVRVRTFSRRRYDALAALGVQQYQGDIGNPAAVLKACRGVNAVFHTAAKTGVWGRYADYYRTNVSGTHNLIAACRQARVARLVHTSSPSVVFDGRDMEGIDESAPYPARFEAPYPQTKALAEKAVVSAGSGDLATIILRPHLIWGPGDNHLVPRILKRASRLRRVGDGRNRVDTVYIDNAAEAHLLADAALAADPALSGRIYFISQDDPLPLWDMVDAILAAGGRRPLKKSISPGRARRLGVALEFLYKILHIPGEPPMTRFVASELATSHWFDISAAKRDLGYRPRVSTAEGLRRLAAWLQHVEPEENAS
jgi:nucleoside-diphosphate-sugar epimerase